MPELKSPRTLVALKSKYKSGTDTVSTVSLKSDSEDGKEAESLTLMGL